jgi:hypothetical protein
MLYYYIYQNFIHLFLKMIIEMLQYNNIEKKCKKNFTFLIGNKCNRAQYQKILEI